MVKRLSLAIGHVFFYFFLVMDIFHIGESECEDDVDPWLWITWWSGPYLATSLGMPALLHLGLPLAPSSLPLAPQVSEHTRLGTDQNQWKRKNITLLSR